MRLIALSAAAFTLAVPPAGFAQTTAPDTLFLRDAIALAEEHNPEYRKVRSQIDLAEVEQRQAWGAMLPSLRLNLSSGFSNSQRLSAFDNFGRPLENEEVTKFTSSSSSQSISLTELTLFDGGANLADLRASRATLRGTESRLEAERARLHAELARRYYDALRAERGIALEQRLLETAREQFAVSEQLLRVAVTNPVDVIGAEVDVARQEQALQKARGDARSAKLLLQREIGLTGEADFVLGGDADERDADPANLDVEALAIRARQLNPEIHRLEHEVNAADHRVRSQWAARLPTLTASAGFARDFSGRDYTGLSEFDPRDQAFSVRFNLSLPLFDQFRTSYAIAQARVQRSAAEEDLRAGRLRIEQEVRTAVLDLENAHSAWTLATRTAELSAQRLEMAREQYGLGTITYTELQNVFQDSAQADRDALTARYDFSKAMATLRERVGGAID